MIDSIEEDLKAKLIELINKLTSLPNERRTDIITALQDPATKVNKDQLDLFFCKIFLDGKIVEDPLVERFIKDHILAHKNAPKAEPVEPPKPKQKPPTS